MDMQERTQQLVERAERLGFRFEYETGLLKAKKPEDCDEQKCEETIAELAGIEMSANGRGNAGFFLPYVRSVFERRATAECAKRYVGHRVWALGYGMGEILDAETSTGNMIVRFGSGGPMSLRAEDAVVIVSDECVPEANEQTAPVTETPTRRGIFEMFCRPSGS